MTIYATDLITAAEIRAALQELIKQAGGQQPLGDRWHINDTTISMAVTGRRNPSPCIIEAMGYEKVVLYRRKKK